MTSYRISIIDFLDLLLKQIIPNRRYALHAEHFYWCFWLITLQYTCSTIWYTKYTFIFIHSQAMLDIFMHANPYPMFNHSIPAMKYLYLFLIIFCALSPSRSRHFAHWYWTLYVCMCTWETKSKCTQKMIWKIVRMMAMMMYKCVYNYSYHIAYSNTSIEVEEKFGKSVSAPAVTELSLMKVTVQKSRLTHTHTNSISRLWARTFQFRFQPVFDLA